MAMLEFDRHYYMVKNKMISLSHPSEEHDQTMHGKWCKINGKVHLVLSLREQEYRAASPVTPKRSKSYSMIEPTYSLGSNSPTPSSGEKIISYLQEMKQLDPQYFLDLELPVLVTWNDRYLVQNKMKWWLSRRPLTAHQKMMLEIREQTNYETSDKALSFSPLNRRRNNN